MSGAMGPSARSLGVALGAELRPQVRALPGLLRTTQLLPLTQVEVIAAVDRALAENPMLRRAPGGPCPGCGRHRRAGRCAACHTGTGVAGGDRSREPPDPGHAPLDALETLAACEVRRHGRAAVPIVIAHLTDRGLLDAGPDEIAELHALDPADVAEALRAVRAVGPPGLAERSVTAVLRAQAEDLAARGQAPGWLPRLVTDHLEAVAADRPDDVARALGVGVPAVRAAFTLVRARLRPFVAAAVARPDPVPPAPDVTVRRAPDGELLVEVADSRWFGLRTATIGARVRRDPDAAAWLAGHRRAAVDLIRQLDARAGVLLRVAEEAVRTQRGRFDHGPARQIDLPRSEVAARLGLHPSTVSRAVAGKVVRGPGGELFALSTLFGSGAAAREHIARLLDERPRSDAELAAALASRGLPVARRTVAKYRAQLGIAAFDRAVPAEPSGGS